jgi:hypothetical protein
VGRQKKEKNIIIVSGEGFCGIRLVLKKPLKSITSGLPLKEAFMKVSIVVTPRSGGTRRKDT